MEAAAGTLIEMARGGGSYAFGYYAGGYPAGPDDEESYVVRVETGGDAVASVLEAVRREVGADPGMIDVGVGHAPGCPAMAGAGMPGCTCDVVDVRIRRLP